MHGDIPGSAAGKRPAGRIDQAVAIGVRAGTVGPKILVVDGEQVPGVEEQAEPVDGFGVGLQFDTVGMRLAGVAAAAADIGWVVERDLQVGVVVVERRQVGAQAVTEPFGLEARLIGRDLLGVERQLGQVEARRPVVEAARLEALGVGCVLQDVGRPLVLQRDLWRGRGPRVLGLALDRGGGDLAREVQHAVGESEGLGLVGPAQSPDHTQAVSDPPRGFAECSIAVGVGDVVGAQEVVVGGGGRRIGGLSVLAAVAIALHKKAFMQIEDAAG